MSFILPSKQKEFWTSISPTLATGGDCIITSTPKSDEDMFAQIWKGANDNTDSYGNNITNGEGKNGFFPVNEIWSAHPDRDEKWADEQRAQLGEARFRQEHCNEFVNDDLTLINPLTLARMKSKEPIYYTGTMRWYSEPQPNKIYLVALDPSLGSGNDDSAIQVFQLPELIQIAEWQHNDSSPKEQVRILMQTLAFLDEELRTNDDQITDPEIYWTFENNSIGDSIIQIIDYTGEDKFCGYLLTERKKIGTIRKARKGMTTAARTKLTACSRMKSLIESDRMLINSNNLIKQLKMFVTFEQSFRAKQGEHDDLVSATLLICRMIDQLIEMGIDAENLKDRIDENQLFEDNSDPMPISF